MQNNKRSINKSSGSNDLMRKYQIKFQGGFRSSQSDHSTAHKFLCGQDSDPWPYSLKPRLLTTQSLRAPINLSDILSTQTCLALRILSRNGKAGLLNRSALKTVLKKTLDFLVGRFLRFFEVQCSLQFLMQARVSNTNIHRSLANVTVSWSSDPDKLL